MTRSNRSHSRRNPDSRGTPDIPGSRNLCIPTKRFARRAALDERFLCRRRRTSPS
jgi:hypothetical protein